MIDSPDVFVGAARETFTRPLFATLTPLPARSARRRWSV
jgi:hypothetical protein